MTKPPVPRAIADRLIAVLLGKSDAGKSYVVFGKTNSTAINLSDIASGTGGFVINGVLCCRFYRRQHKIFLLLFYLGRHNEHQQSNHLSHRR
jgi:hypothetical protein